MASHESGLSTVVGDDSPFATLNFSTLPPIYISSTHLPTGQLQHFEEELESRNATLTCDINEASIVLTKVSKKARLKLDFRSKGILLEEVNSNIPVWPQSERRMQKRKRRKTDSPAHEDRESLDIDADIDSSTASEASVGTVSKRKRSESALADSDSTGPRNVISVLRLDWLEESLQVGAIKSPEHYLILQARCVHSQLQETNKPKSEADTPKAATAPSQSILERAQEDAIQATHQRKDRFGRRTFASPSKAIAHTSWSAGHGSSQNKYAHLIHATTSENEGEYTSDIPEMPDWVRRRVKYACQRSTPLDTPNAEFIALLLKIRVARELAADEIGVRAYSTSIASLAAYPNKVTNPLEILALPGCDVKIANLFVEFMNTDQLKAVQDLEADAELAILKLFFNIWGVGAITAREFYYDRGWRDLDDIVEHGWKTLSRVQQIGVKYYDEFLDLLPRIEVEEIAKIVHRHAIKVRDERIQSIIVGGYRRGKEACGDVDIIVSHPEEQETAGLVTDIVSSLEEEGWITHTLLLSLNNTSRDQKTLPYRTGGGGHGFDSLDKALVVWQNPNWPDQDKSPTDANTNSKKNPNIHRRVDIIISPWRTVGCAIVGWSGGTTFERDLRRYAKYNKRWKFDSSGVRSRVNGEVIDLEGWVSYNGNIGSGRAKDMDEAERRVFEGMGLEYQEPWNRCTG